MAGFNPSDNTFTINENAFSKCAPAISNNIKECGTVTACNAKPMTSGDLDDVFMKSNEFRVMEALFHHDMEIKMCEAVQNGLYDFFMSQKVSLHAKMNTKRLSAGLLEIAPFVMARQYSPINNEYFVFSSGAVVGANLTGRVTSTTNIPPTVQNFPAGLRVFIEGKTGGGTAVRTAWQVVSSSYVAGNSYVSVVLASQNDGSRMKDLFSDKLHWLTTGLLTRGTPNKSDYEKWCNEAPSYLNWKNVPFWVESTRDSLCRSELYAKWRKLVLADNPLYKEFFDLPEIEKNKQIAADFQKRLVRQMFSGKPLPNQNSNDYSNLDDIEFPTLGPIGLDGDGNSLGIGTEGGRCVGKRANFEGIYEQHAACRRVLDLQGDALNIPALARALYNMMRVRKSNGKRNPMVFDFFTDSVYAELFNQAMLQYYTAKSNNTMRLNVNGEGFSIAKEANFGFYYRSYSLFWPQGIKINIITHEFFDDYITAMIAADANAESSARVLWILDFAGIYPGILASNRIVNKTGDLKTMAAVSEEAACVMAVPWKEWTHYSLIMTVICECPMGNLIIENIENSVPEVTERSPQLNYDSMASGSSTTTTTLTTVL